MARNQQQPPSVPRQEFDYRNTTNVSKAMIKAGTEGKSRIKAGVRAAWNAKVSSMYGEDTTKGAIALRLMGAQGLAKWYDRFVAKESKKQKDQESDGGDGGSSRKASVVAATGAKQIKGELKGLNRKLDVVFSVVSATRGDVSDIKSMLMPKITTIKGTSGKDRDVQFNPLAPQGNQFQDVTKSGALTYKKLSGKDKENAGRKVAEATAKLVLAMQKKDKETAELKQKYGYKDESEKYKEEDPITALRTHMDERFDKLESSMKDKKGGFFSTLMTLLGGWAMKIFAGPIKLIKSLWGFTKKIWNLVKGPLMRIVSGVKTAFDFVKTRILIPLWDAIAAVMNKIPGLKNIMKPWGAAAGAAAAAGAVVAGGAAAIDQGMKQGADKAIDGVLSDVTKNQEKAGFKPEESYKAYAMAMDKSLEGLSEERKAYHKQQWLRSEGLSELEKSMAAKYFQEKEGGKGPTSRGGRKGREEGLAPPTEITPTPEPAPAPAPPISTSAPAPVPAPSAPAPTRTPTPAPSAPATGGTGTLTTKPKGDLPMPGDAIKEYILAAAKKVGVDAGIMMAVAKQESSFDPNAVPINRKTGKLLSSAKGLYQFINSTWDDMVRKYGGKYPELHKGPMDPLASAVAGALFIKENADFLKKRGLPVNGTSIYAAHFLGAGGAAKLFNADPNALAAQIMPAAAKSNPHIFYKDGREKTIAEVQDTLFQKVGKYAEQYTAALNGQGGQPTTQFAAVAPTPSASSSSSVAPAPSTSGAAIDKGSRELMASNASAPPVTMVSAPQVTNNNTNNTTAKRPMIKADVVNRDEAFVRSASRDAAHPVYG